MLAARTAVEEGLYRKEKLAAEIPDQKEREAVVNLLWSLFVLDRQFNFAAGWPHQLSDSDVDLPAPVSASVQVDVNPSHNNRSMHRI